ncbi:hypothetical protein [Spirosoma spitsbergense]|nr:hypothetical protein [Spirosoma spitsbergense]
MQLSFNGHLLCVIHYVVINGHLLCVISVHSLQQYLTINDAQQMAIKDY